MLSSLSVRQNCPKEAVTYLCQGARQAEVRAQSSPEQLVSLQALSQQPVMPPLLEKLAEKSAFNFSKFRKCSFPWKEWACLSKPWLIYGRRKKPKAFFLSFSERAVDSVSLSQKQKLERTRTNKTMTLYVNNLNDH